MALDYGAFRKFEDDMARREGPLGYDRALVIFTSLWEEGRALHKLPPTDPLEGIDIDINVARILNSCSRN